MNHFSDKEKEVKELFNREVLILLVKYFFKYKSQLLTSLLLVSTITSTTISIPWITRYIIDNAIIKTGRLLTHTDKPVYSGLKKQILKSIKINSDTSFLFQYQLSSFSKHEIDSLSDASELSKATYTLITLPDQLPNSLQSKLTYNISNDSFILSNGYLLINAHTQRVFTAAEMLILRSEDIKKILYIALALVMLFIIQFIASYSQMILLMKLSQNAMRDLRIDLYNHIITLETSFFDRNPVGKLVSRVVHDIESLNELFSSVLVTLTQDILILSGITTVLFLTDFKLACVVSFTFPPLIISTLIFRLKARKAYRVIRTKIADLNTFLNENISGIRLVQIFTRESRQYKRFVSINSDVFKANIRQLKVYAVFRPGIDLLRWCAVAGVIFFGAHSIIDGRISYGLLVMFLAYISNFFEPIADLAEKFDILQSATAAGEKILEIFNTPVRKEIHSGTLLKSGSPVTYHGEICFKNVWFSYVRDEWVLKDLSFTIPPKTTIAVVGDTGSGKSSIINLLTGMYQFQKGSITIDGTSITDIAVDKLREQTAIVMQDIFLFSRSVKDNIILGKQFDRARFSQITQLTHLDKFIDQLPNGIEEEVMERGVTFSAGQRQLLAFARALYVDPALLILDEATSNIDTDTELLIQDAISKLVKGRTSIVIAHRLSTIRKADKIIVIDNGSIIESGTHDELIVKKGRYHELCKLQFEKI